MIHFRPQPLAVIVMPNNEKAGARPFDGHTLAPILNQMQEQIGVESKRIYIDKGYRGHQYPNLHNFVKIKGSKSARLGGHREPRSVLSTPPGIELRQDCD